MADAIQAAVLSCIIAQSRWTSSSIDERLAAAEIIRGGFASENARLAELEFTETCRGRIEDKIMKTELVIRKTPGAEMLKMDTLNGASGITHIGFMSTGVWVSITPVTNPVATVVNNIISLISGGNAVVFQPHPDAEKCTTEAVKVYRELFIGRPEIQDLVCVLNGIRHEMVVELVNASGIAGVLITGGRAIVNLVMKHCTKRVIAAGPGNPPCYVDDSYRNLAHAADLITRGGGFDNNMLCTDEKAVIVHSRIYKQLLKAFEQTGRCVVYNDPNVIAKFDSVLKADCSEPLPHLVGKSAVDILKYLKVRIPTDHEGKDIRLIVLGVNSDLKNRMIWAEQMLPVMPVVKAESIKEACSIALQVEGGRFHSASLWAQDIFKIQEYTDALQVTNLVINGPIYSGLGLGGQGDTSFSIAGWTGEGFTDVRTFCRQRRITYVSPEAHPNFDESVAGDSREPTLQ